MSAGNCKSPKILAPFNPTCNHTQEVALRLLRLSSTDVLFDLGCGDGRLLRTAATTCNSRCIGIEIDPVFSKKAVDAILLLNDTMLQSLIDIRQGDALDTFETLQPADATIGSQCRDLTLKDDATAIYLYLLPKGLVRIKPLLDAMTRRRNEIRIVTYMFAMHGWVATEIDRSSRGGAPVYLYEFKHLA